MLANGRTVKVIGEALALQLQQRWRLKKETFRRKTQLCFLQCCALDLDTEPAALEAQLQQLESR